MKPPQPLQQPLTPYTFCCSSNKQHDCCRKAQVGGCCNRHHNHHDPQHNSSCVCRGPNQNSAFLYSLLQDPPSTLCTQVNTQTKNAKGLVQQPPHCLSGSTAAIHPLLVLLPTTYTNPASTTHTNPENSNQPLSTSTNLLQPSLAAQFTDPPNQSVSARSSTRKATLLLQQTLAAARSPTSPSIIQNITMQQHQQRPRHWRTRQHRPLVLA